jgi:predicted Fe-Mo cluster-binding NifX family protein
MNQRFAVAIEESNGKVDKVAEHFGRCSKFIVCEITPQKEIARRETYFNPLNGHDGGQCQLPGYIKQFDISAIIAGGMGRKAVVNFHDYGIEVITAPGLEVDQALSLFLQGKISGYEECAGHDHEC